ncbi:MAG TPA: aldo/keto reductase [Anaerolineae bacterium]|nr:aldo/keto reductase [Anaerolineae bacterium]
MEYRKLGRTGLDVSAISVGTEHLLRQPPETVTSVIRESIAHGVNYFDVVFSFPEYLDNLGQALRGYRRQVFLTGHLGSTVRDGQYCRSRSAKAAQPFFQDVLTRLGTDYVDILFLHNFNSLREWETVTRPKGQLEVALRHKAEGRARLIGISGHNAEVVEQACNSGHVDVVMFPVNLLGHAAPARSRLLDLCLAKGLGLVAMKPYGGGRLLTARGTQRVASYQAGGESYKVRFPGSITPAQCLSYTLAQTGVSTALVGTRTEEEVEAAVAVLGARDAERDFSGLLTAFGRTVEGECVYCNHCLPCPEAIDIAEVNRLLDAARAAPSVGLRDAYNALAARASACTECGACVQRCPFGVAVIDTMRAAVAFFGA